MAPVITGNTTTRNRSTSPASTSDRSRLKLPSVRSPAPSATPSVATSCSILGHDEIAVELLRLQGEMAMRGLDPNLHGCARREI